MARERDAPSSPLRGGVGGGGRPGGTASPHASRPPPPTPPRKGEGSARGATGSVEPGLILLGEFGRAHGLKGEVRLKSYTADPLAIASYGPLATDRGGTVALGRVRQAAGDQPDLLVATVAGVSTREAAEALNRTRVFVARGKLPAAEDEDEFLLADLIGLAAVDEDGTELGRVLAVPNYGGGDLLEIAPAAGGPSYLLPFTKAVVPAVDVAAGRLTVRSPEVEHERA